MSESNRMAELALELFGAKAANEFLREAWAAADDDARRQIAAALIAGAVGMANQAIKDNYGPIRNVLDEELRSTARRIVAERAADIEAVIRAKLAEPALAEAMKRAANEACEAAIGEVRKKLGLYR